MIERYMKKIEEKSAEQEQPDIAKFLLQDTLSLRNEIKFTELTDLVHPLTFTHDAKKHSNINLIPLMDKSENKDLKDIFLKIFE